MLQVKRVLTYMMPGSDEIVKKYSDNFDKLRDEFYGRVNVSTLITVTRVFNIVNEISALTHQFTASHYFVSSDIYHNHSKAFVFIFLQKWMIVSFPTLLILML